MFSIRSHASAEAGFIEPGVPPESLEAEVSRLHAGLLQKARRQEHFIDEVCLTPAQIRARPTYIDCRQELFLLFQWLKDELKAVPALEDLAGSIGRCPLRWCLLDDSALSEAHLPMLGPGKRRMHELCLALEANPGPAARIAAAAHLRRIFFDGSQPTADAVAVLTQAVAAVGTRGAPSVAPVVGAATGTVVGETVRRWQENEDGVRNRMHAALDRFGAMAARHEVPIEGVIADVRARFLQAPSGGEDDWVGHMQRFGIDGLEQVLDRLASPGLTAAQEKGVVKELTQALRAKTNPAAEIQLIALYGPPQASPSQVEREDRIRKRTIRGEVEAKASERLSFLPPAERKRRVDRETYAVMDRLGFDYLNGEDLERHPSGLLDLSSDGLVALLDRVEQAVAKDRADRAGRSAR